MNNFKSGSGNLNFGDDDDEEEPESESPQPQATPEEVEAQPDSSVNPKTANATASSEDSNGDQAGQSTTSNSSPTESVESSYPYFVRRNNVGDERDKRLEIHVREQVAQEEGQFRSQLAELLDTNEVSKTDAREFALLAAFQHPEQVAELMREEGFGAVN
ncbi:MAG: hypothetical protein ACI8XM_000740 [Haloarculaceae archaeon]|jgi:hypothetical protein